MTHTADYNSDSTYRGRKNILMIVLLNNLKFVCILAATAAGP
jgi:hypothetical protein